MIRAIRKHEIIDEENYRKIVASNEELEQFAYRTSHDLTAPLTTTLGFCNLIKKDLKHNKLDRIELHTDKAIKCVTKLQNLIKDILDISRASLRDNPVSEINFQKIIVDTKEKLTSLIEENNVSIKTEFNHQKPFYSQEVRLTQIIENLISNGCKYSNKEIEKPEVKVATRDSDPKTIEIIFSDNGIGIPEESQGKLFTMFFRAHQKRSFGSGLGLYLTKKHVGKLNGNIDFKSNERGTSFNVVLPNETL